MINEVIVVMTSDLNMMRQGHPEMTRETRKMIEMLRRLIREMSEVLIDENREGQRDETLINEMIVSLTRDPLIREMTSHRTNVMIDHQINVMTNAHTRKKTLTNVINHSHQNLQRQE